MLPRTWLSTYVHRPPHRPREQRKTPRNAQAETGCCMYSIYAVCLDVTVNVADMANHWAPWRAPAQASSLCMCPVFSGQQQQQQPHKKQVIMAMGEIMKHKLAIYANIFQCLCVRSAYSLGFGAHANLDHKFVKNSTNTSSFMRTCVDTFVFFFFFCELVQQSSALQ